MDATLQDVTTGWSVVDLTLAIGLLLSVLVGVWRGLLTEVLSLLGWAVAYFAAQWWGPQAGASIPVGEVGSRVNVLAGMMVVFVAAWIGWALLSWALRQMVRASVLNGTDRVLGALFGWMRGVLVALVIVTLVDMTPLNEWGPWQASHGVLWLRVLLNGLRPVLPDEVVEFLPAA